MIICPVCGFRNPDANDKCFRCSALLKRNPELIRESFESADRKRKLRERGQWLAIHLDQFRESGWYRRLNRVPDDDRYRYPFTAGLLGILWPGLGHIYGGQPIKAAMLALIALACVVAAVLTIHQPWSNWILGALLFFWLWTWAASVALSMRANGAHLQFRHEVALVFAAMFLLGTTLTVSQYLGLGFLSIEKVTSQNMRPGFEPGERLLFFSVPYWFRQPRINEVILYDPPRFSAESGKDVVSLNIKKYYQRVVGVAGDRIEKRGTEMFRNAQQIPQEQLPFGAETMGDFSVVVPEGMIFAPVTRIPEPDMLAALQGAPRINYMGDPSWIFHGWEGFPCIDASLPTAKGIAILDPPHRRRWLPF